MLPISNKMHAISTSIDSAQGFYASPSFDPFKPQADNGLTIAIQSRVTLDESNKEDIYIKSGDDVSAKFNRIIESNGQTPCDC